MNRLIALQGDMRLLLGLEADETFELVFDASVLKHMDTGAVPFAELSERLAGRPGYEDGADEYTGVTCQCELAKVAGLSRSKPERVL